LSYCPPCTASCSGVAIQQSRDLSSDLVGRYDQRAVQMYVALRDSARRMPEQPRYRQLGEPEVASDTCEGMAKDVGRHITKLRLSANAIEDTDDPDEVSVSPVWGKDEGCLSEARSRLYA